MEKILYRDAQIRASSIDQEARTIELAFSSEEPVERAFGMEVLSHAPGAADLTRLNSGGPLLLNHDSAEQIGVVERARIDGDKVGRAIVKFSQSVKGQEIFQDVRDGIRKSVSVGYRILKFEETKQGRVPEIIATKWQPLEISMVAVPADATVGVGREYFQTDKENGKMNVETEQWTAEQKERRRCENIAAIGEQLGGDIQQAAFRFIREGKSLNEFKRFTIDYQARQQNDFEVDYQSRNLGPSGNQEYSLLKVIRAMADKSWDQIGFEREVSQELSRQIGKQPEGIFIPIGVLSRDVAKGGTGVNLVPTTLLPQEFIDVLRPHSLTLRLGARVLNGLVGDVDITQKISGSNVSWIAEGSPAGQSDAVYGKVSMRPKTLAAKSKVTRKMLLQSSPAIEQLTRDDLGASIGTELDRVIIAGSGTGEEPTGILNASGVGLVSLGTNGAVPTWQSILDLESTIAGLNADSRLAYLANAKVRAKLKGSLKFTGGDTPIWEDRPVGDNSLEILNSRPAGVSENVPSNLTKGTGSNLSAILCGNFADVLLGQWGVLDIQVDPYTAGDEGAVIVRAFQDVDIKLRRPASFAVIKDAITV